MFGELPKVFDKNFAVNNFLPMTAFIGLSYFFLRQFGLAPSFMQVVTQDLIKGAVMLSLFAYFGGVLLLVLNNDMYSFLSGMGKLNPFRLLHGFEKRRYRRMRTEIEKLNVEYSSYLQQGIDLPEKLRLKRNRLMGDIAVQFPDQERYILPTPFGNIVRSVEVYSRLNYGIDYAAGWSRMLTVIPADYRNLIESSKSQVDFWINTYLLSVCFLIEVIIVWSMTDLFYLLGIACTVILFASLLIIRAQAAALNWREYVGAAFDVYRLKLLDMLGVDRPYSRNDEKILWTKISQSVIYGIPGILPNLSKLASSSNTTIDKNREEALPQTETADKQKKEIIYLTPPEIKIELHTPFRVKKRNRTL